MADPIQIPDEPIRPNNCGHCASRAFLLMDGAWHCLRCQLYNLAVGLQRTAAEQIARNKNPKATDAWLNQYGVFAYVDGVAQQVATAAEAEPFVALTRIGGSK